MEIKEQKIIEQGKNHLLMKIKEMECIKLLILLFCLIF